MKTYVIAEVGPNHNGSLKMAMEYVDKLSDIGVNAIKFQLTKPNLLFSKDSKFAKYQLQNSNYNDPKQMIKETQLSKSSHIKIYERCLKKNIDYLCTAFDLDSIKFLNKNFNLKYFKIASGEIFSIDVLEYISKYKKKIITSRVDGIESFAIFGDSEHFEKTLIVTLFFGSKKSSLEIILFLQNHAFEKNYNRIQILTQSQLSFDDYLEYKLSFHLMKKLLN